MKKKLLLLPAFLLAFSLAACNQGGGGEEKKEDESGEKTNPGGETNPGQQTDSGGETNPGQQTDPGEEEQGGEEGGEATPGEGDGDGSESVTIPAEGLAARIGNQAFLLTADPAAQNEGAFADREQGYLNMVSNVKQGDAIEFYLDGAAVTTFNAAGDNTAAEPPVYNNYVKTASGFAIQADNATEQKFYVNLWKANDKGEKWLTFFLEGGASANHEGSSGGESNPQVDPGESYALTVNVFDDFLSGGAKIAVYAWKNGGEQKAWYDVSASGAQITIAAGLDRFIVARVNPAKTSADKWEEYVWNQTEDFTVDTSKTSVSVTGWGSGYGAKLAATY